MTLAFVVSLIVWCVVLGLVWYLLNWLISISTLPAPIQRVLQILLALVLVLIVLDHFLPMLPFAGYHHSRFLN